MGPIPSDDTITSSSSTMTNATTLNNANIAQQKEIDFGDVLLVSEFFTRFMREFTIPPPIDKRSSSTSSVPPSLQRTTSTATTTSTSSSDPLSSSTTKNGSLLPKKKRRSSKQPSPSPPPLDDDNDNSQSPSSSVSFSPPPKIVTPDDILSAIQYKTDVERHTHLSSIVQRLTRARRVVKEEQQQQLQQIQQIQLEDNNAIMTQQEIIDEETATMERSILMEDTEQGRMRMEKEVDTLLVQHANAVEVRKQIRVGGGDDDNSVVRMSTDEHVESLLSAFEVWSTKAIANEMLLPREPSDSAAANGGTDDFNSFCNFLNIPGEGFFSEILPASNIEVVEEGEQISTTTTATTAAGTTPPSTTTTTSTIDSGGTTNGKKSTTTTTTTDETTPIPSPPNSPTKPPPPTRRRTPTPHPSLPIPPNHLTSPELLRISLMLSTLSSNTARLNASHSPLANVTQGPYAPTRRLETECLYTSGNAHHREIGVGDLMALWVRAQRNGLGLRHLFNLFLVVEDGSAVDSDVGVGGGGGGGKKKKLVLKKKLEHDLFLSGSAVSGSSSSGKGEGSKKDIKNMASGEEETNLTGSSTGGIDGGGLVQTDEIMQDTSNSNGTGEISSSKQQQQPNTNTLPQHPQRATTDDTATINNTTTTTTSSSPTIKPDNGDHTQQPQHVKSEFPYTRRKEHKAKFMGNTRYTRSKVDKEGGLVDDLIEWAIINQVLFTHRYIRKDIAKMKKMQRQEEQQARGDTLIIEEIVDSGDMRKDDDTNTNNSSMKRDRENSGILSSPDRKKTRRQTPPPKPSMNEVGPVRRTMNEVGPPVAEPPARIPDRLANLDDETKIQHRLIKETFLLRWFARRNRDILTILFSSNPRLNNNTTTGNKITTAADRKLRQILSLGSLSSVKKLLKKNIKCSDPTDRTFPRIDRRILIGKYYPVEQHGSLYDAVSSLLQTLRSAVELKNEDSPLVNDMLRAELDFADLCRRFLDDPYNRDLDDVVLAATDVDSAETTALLPPSPNNNDTNNMNAKIEQQQEQNKAAMISHQLPKPWRDRCQICDGNVKDEDITARCCWNCGIFAHDRCCACNDDASPAPSSSLERFLVSSTHTLYGDMADEVRRSNRETVETRKPDFVKHSISWLRQVITLSRNKRSDAYDSMDDENTAPAEYPTWGTNLGHTKECEEALEKCTTTFQTTSPKLPLPIKVPHEGLLVTGVEVNSIAAQCGLQPGDVVVQLREGGSSPSKNSSSSPDEDDLNISLAGMTPNECRQLFDLGDIASLVVIVERPSTTIVEIAQEYEAALLDLQKEAGGDYDELKVSQWYCDKCRPNSKAAGGVVVGGLVGEVSVLEEAELCLAVIRRLGMEWCSLAFHDEARDDDDDDLGFGDSSLLGVNQSNKKDEHVIEDKANVSLCRLDHMMETIIAKERNLHPQDRDNTRYSAFCSNVGKRLDWADESLELRPFDLLVKGVSLIVNPLTHQTKDATNSTNSTTPDKYTDQRLEMRQKFIKLFVAWCLDFRGMKCFGIGVTKGPPLYARKAIKPWIVDSCRVCYRPVNTDDNEQLPLLSDGICNRKVCRKVYEESDQINSDIDDIQNESKIRNSNHQTNLLGETASNGNKIRKDDVKDNLHEESNHPFDEILSKDDLIHYDFHSSLIGSMILVLPTDPIITSLSEALQFPVDHGGRLCEFLVASYLPCDFISTKQLSAPGLVRAHGIDTKEHAKNGLFYLIPVLNENQLNFVFELCKMRNPSKAYKGGSSGPKKKWIDLKIFQLEGIIELTPEELLVRISSTASINTAINNEIVSMAIRDGNNESKQRSRPDTQMIDLLHFEQLGLDLAGSWYLWQLYFNLSSSVVVKSSRYLKLMSLQVDLLYYLDTTIGRSIVKRDLTYRQNSSFNNSEDNELTDVEASGSESESKLRNDGWNGHGSSLRSKKGIGGKQCHILQGMVSFQDSGAAKNLCCTVCYSDLIYWYNEKHGKKRGITNKKSATYMKRLEKMLIKEPFLVPRVFKGNLRRLSGSAAEDVHTILLHRLTPEFDEDHDEEEENEEEEEEWQLENNGRAPAGKYTGKGWGFEMVRWFKEGNALRVGRVAPDSPAFQGGLRVHDIVLAVNGRAISSFKSDFILAKEVLSSPEIRSVPRAMAKQFPSASVLYHMNDVSKGPVIIEVYRTKNPTQQTLEPKPVVQQVTSHHNIKNTSPTNPRNNGVEAHKSHLVNRPVSAGIPHHYPPSTNGNGHYPGRSPPTHEFGAPAPVNVIKPTVINPTHHSQQIFTQAPERPGFPPQSTQTPVVPHDGRKPLSARHLYLPGLAESFLSLCETAVLVEAVHRKSPYLGMRLLCPRYDTNKIRAEYESLICPYVNRHGYVSIPQLSEDQWSFILAADYKRSEHESGSVAFSENGYSYHIPTGKLPLDRLLEHYHKRQTPLPQQYSPRHQNPQHHQYQQPYSQTPVHQQPSTGIPPYLPDQGQGTGLGPGQNYNCSNYDTSVVDNSSYRIRGGGTEEQPRPSFELPVIRMALSRMRVEQWSGTVVYGECRNDNEAEISHLFVGKVKSPIAHIHDNTLFSEALVDIFYLSSVGYLARYKSTTIAHCDIYVVEGGEAMSIASKWFGRHTVDDQQQTLMKDNEITGVTATVDTCDASITLNNAARVLMQKLQHRISGSVNLGSLPDGSAVHLFISDPTSLYRCLPIIHTKIEGASSQMERLSRSRLKMLQSKYRGDVIQNEALLREGKKTYLHPCQPGMHCCVWGCSKPAESTEGQADKRMMLAFSSEQELIHHIDHYHSYTSTLTSLNFNDSRWERICQGSQIKKLCAGLTSSICARQPQLADLLSPCLIDDKLSNEEFSLSPFDKSYIFDSAKILRLTHSESGAPDFSSLRDKCSPNRTIIRLISLWSRISRLFTLETDGNFRLGQSYFHNNDMRQEESTGIMTHGDSLTAFENDLISQLDETIAGIVADKYQKSKKEIAPMFSNPPCPSYRSKSLGIVSNQASCLLCCTSSENMILLNEIDMTSDTQPIKHGAGCSIICELCFKKHNNPYRNIILRAADALNPIQGQLDAVKLLMIKTAANIPPSLFPSCSKSCAKYVIPLLDHEIWNESNLQIWIEFVSQCINSRMIAQAYVILLSSINKKRMPPWWKSSRSGWTSSYAIMNMPTLSKLALHIHVLDVAVAQFMANRSVQQPKPSSKSSTTQNNKKDDEKKLGDDQNKNKAPKKMRKLPTELLNLSLKQQMETVIQWAQHSGIPLHDGITDDDCHICDNGGFVLCCEYCVNVAHPECIGFKGNNEEIDWDFVCDECSKDIYNVWTQSSE